MVFWDLLREFGVCVCTSHCIPSFGKECVMKIVHKHCFGVDSIRVQRGVCRGGVNHNPTVKPPAIQF